MRRKRQRLQVSTFPFLAVLLCVMGSLILLLLVFDRRAKIVAQAKARQAAAKRETEAEAQRQKLLAERNADLARQQELRDRLAREQGTIAARLRQVQAEKARLKHAVARDQEVAIRLERQFRQEEETLNRLRREIEQRRAELLQAKREAESYDAELHRLAGELHRLEKMLAESSALRHQSARTYSVLPYAGRRGEDRRPVYAECTARGVIFHPDGVKLEGAAFTPLGVRRELERRISECAPSGEKKPYLFVLVRPDAVESYYDIQTALAGLPIDFGYELIESDWVLDFSGKTKFDGLGGQVPQPRAGFAGGESARPALPGLPSGQARTRDTALGARGQASGAKGHPVDGADRSVLPYPAAAPQRPPPLSRLTGNRDWYLPIRCERDKIVLPLSRREFTSAELMHKHDGEHPLARTVRDTIERRQATVRPGEPPYRPILRFEVSPDGLLNYHLAYSILERLALPMERHNIEPQAHDLSEYYRK